MGKGIVVAGNIVVDKIKIVDAYPNCGMLTNINDMVTAVGGAVCNTGIDLKIIDGDLSVKAYGLVGKDSEGEYVVNQLNRYGLDTSNILTCDIPTSFTDVMTIGSTGERTFFHNRGANKQFSLTDMQADELDCDIFHIGYLLLLDKLDDEDVEFGTHMARLLSRLQARGIKTSIDVVSENSNRFSRVVAPSLKYCNYVIINEIEAGEVANIKPRNDNGQINIQNIITIMTNFFALGVKDTVIIHCPEGGFAMDSSGKFSSVGSFILPKGYIKGTVGAGDAFCAGALYSIYNNFDNNKMLKFASACAACNLSQSDSISGMCGYSQIQELEGLFFRRQI